MTTSAIPPAGVHGGDAESVAAALGIETSALLDLSASMNPCAVDPLPIVRRHLRSGLDHYPDPARATAALASAMSVDPDRLLLTNGGAEAISLLAAEIGGTVAEPAFALHPRDRRPIPSPGHRAGILPYPGTNALPRWCSNPHSPTGLLAAADATADVWDEAFYPLATGRWTRGDTGVPVVGSLTKLLAAPGLRVGYVLADPDLIAACRARQPQWSVSGLTCAALPDLLSSTDLPGSARQITVLRARLVELLRAYGLAPRPSDANWVLVDEPGLRERLAPHGVLVRDCASFGLAGVARIAVPDAAGLTRLDRALDASSGGERSTVVGGVGDPALPSPGFAYRSAVAAIRPVDSGGAGAAAAARHDRLTKPRGALGRLESLGSQLAAITRVCPPPVPQRATVCLFAADHGVLARGVSPWPREVTAQMVTNICAGGAAISVFAGQVGADVIVTDVGVATPIPDPRPSAAPRSAHARSVVFRRRPVGPGTADLSRGPAMTATQAQHALDIGAKTAQDAVAAGAQLLITGDMGIGNTTAAAALIAAFTHLPAAEVTGRGTGIDDDTLSLKTDIVTRAVARLGPAADPLEILAALGGFEIAALAGLIVGGAAAGVPVLVDGAIAVSAALVACAAAPNARGYVIAGHRSVEPGSGAALRHLGLEPLLDLDLRLGEGTGAVLALPLVQAAARVLHEMATFDNAAVAHT